MEKDQDFLEFVVKSLVDSPDVVKVTRNVDEMGVLLTLDVDAGDMGTIIGRNGATAKAIRTLLRVVGLKNSARVNLKINEPVGGKRDGERAGERAGERDGEKAGERDGERAGSVSEDVDKAMEDLKL